MRYPLWIAGLLLTLPSGARAFLDQEQQESLSSIQSAASELRETPAVQEPAPTQPAACARDLSKGAIVMLSGGPVDGMNPPEVRDRMDAYLDGVNAAEFVSRCSSGKGLAVSLLKGQQTKHLHQSLWREICDALAAADASPIVIAGHSYGGASAVSLSRCLEGKGKAVDLLITADSVLAGNDLGNVNVVPANVKLNINTFVIPNVLTWLPPFPFGRANTRDAADAKPTINIGMEYMLPGVVSHRNAFYDFAGGDKQAGGYARPFVLLDLTLAYLAGADESEMTRLALEKSDALAKASGIKVIFEGPGSKAELPRP